MLLPLVLTNCLRDVLSEFESVACHQRFVMFLLNSRCRLAPRPPSANFCAVLLANANTHTHTNKPKLIFMSPACPAILFAQIGGPSCSSSCQAFIRGAPTCLAPQFRAMKHSPLAVVDTGDARVDGQSGRCFSRSEKKLSKLNFSNRSDDVAVICFNQLMLCTLTMDNLGQAISVNSKRQPFKPQMWRVDEQ